MNVGNVSWIVVYSKGPGILIDWDIRLWFGMACLGHLRIYLMFGEKERKMRSKSPYQRNFSDNAKLPLFLIRYHGKQ